MPQYSGQPPNYDPSKADMFRMFRDMTVACISGLHLLLKECADLRAELITMDTHHTDGSGAEFAARQERHMSQLEAAATDMEGLLARLPEAPHDTSASESSN